MHRHDPDAVHRRDPDGELGWHRYVGDGGAIVGMQTFGASAPLKMLVERFGFTPDALSKIARERIAASNGN